MKANRDAFEVVEIIVMVKWTWNKNNEGKGR